MALQPYTVTVPRGQEHLLPSPMPRRAPIGISSGRTVTTTGAGGANIAALDALRRAKELYEPGGGFGAGIEAGLERGRVKAVSTGMQHLVGAGLAGTTMVGTLGKKYEEEVAAPTRMGVEERRTQAISGIEMAMANMIQQASQAKTGMEFQAVQASAQRDLQRYMTDLQATLQREQMAPRGPTMTAPTDGGYARQFPSIYDTAEQRVPDWMDSSPRPYSTPDPTVGQPIMGGSQAGGMYLGDGRSLSPEQVEWR